MSDYYDYLGLIGGLILSISLLPQIVKVCRTKSADDLSLGWHLIAIIGLICLTVYGFVKNLWPIYLTALIEILLFLCLLVLKFYYDSKNNTNDNSAV